MPDGPDQLDTAERAAAWCAAQGLPSITNQKDCDRLREFREVLRDVIYANNGEGDLNRAWDALRPFAESAQIGFTVDSQRGPMLRPRGDGAGAVIAALLALVNDAVCDGTWSHMRACRKDTCRFAYYDRSKNGSRAWCSMAVCGNREKAHRRRQRDRAL